MEQLHRGDIIFNHKQTEELLSNGKVISNGGHGRVALADGTARNTLNISRAFHGGNIPDKNLTGNSSSSNSGGNTTPTTPISTRTTNSNNNNGKKTLDKILDAVSKLFDWIEVKLDTTQKHIDNFLQKAENAIGYQNKNAYVNKAVSEVKALIGYNQQGAKKYKDKADELYNEVLKNVGTTTDGKQKDNDNKFSPKERASYKSAIEILKAGGTIDLTKYTTDVRSAIESFQDLWDKGVDCELEVEKLNAQLKDLQQTKLDNITDEFETITGLSSSVQDTSKSMVEYLSSTGQSVNSSGIKNEYKSQLSQQALITSTLENEKTAYAAELANAKKVFGESSVEYKKALTNYNAINKELTDSKVAYRELQDALWKLDNDAIENVINNFKQLADKISNVVSLLTARGKTVSESTYKKQIGINNAMIEQQYKERNRIYDKIISESKNGMTSTSDRYKDLKTQLDECDNSILQLLTDNESLKDSIIEARWKSFKDLQENISTALDDLGALRDLLNNDGLYDKNGNITDQGNANIALLASSIELAKGQVADYRKALEKLDIELANGNISQEEYNESSKEYISNIKSSVSSIKGFKDALIEMYKTQMEKENSALKESIELRKEALSKKKDYYEYDKTLKSKTKDIASLQAQIAALEGVNNQASKAELARLKEQLSDAQDDLKDTVKDHEYEIKVSGYDTMADDADKAMEAILEELNINSEKQQEIVNQMLGQLKTSYSSAYSEIQSIIKDTGLVIGNITSKSIEELSNVASAIEKVNSAKQEQSSVGSSSTANSIDTSKIETGTKTTEKAEEVASSSNVDLANTVDRNATIKAEEDAKAAAVAAKLKAEADAARAAADAQAKAKADAAAKAKAEADAKAKAEAEAKRVANLNSTKLAKLSSLSTKSSATNIKLMKDSLAKLGYKGMNSSSTWGSGTKSAIKSFKKKYKLSGGTTSLNSTAIKKLVELLKAKGYENGTLSADDELAWTQENAPEMIVRKSDGAILTKLGPGDGVIPANLTENLWDWGRINPKDLWGVGASSAGNIQNIKKTDMSVNLHYDNLINVQGNVDKAVITDLEKLTKDITASITKDFSREFQKTYGRR